MQRRLCPSIISNSECDEFEAKTKRLASCRRDQTRARGVPGKSKEKKVD